MEELSRRILVLGARGRLAGSLIKNWSARHRVVALARPDLDVSDVESLRRLLGETDFDVLVNGTGLTNVDLCETNRDEAERLNAIAPGVMAECAGARGAKMIHFSTDYVFDGTKEAPLTETDPVLPCGWYGKTKLSGEHRVLAAGPQHVVARVSWVFGPAKPSFVDALIDRACNHAQVSAVSDKFSSPTFAEDVADWLAPFLGTGAPGGLYHACNSGSCSWQEYGTRALEIAAALGLPLRTTTVDPTALADMKQFIAPRPVYSILSTRKLAATIAHTPRHWHDALQDYIFKKYAPLPSQP